MTAFNPAMSESEAQSFVECFLATRPEVARMELLRQGDWLVPNALLPQRASGYAEACSSGEGSQYHVSEAGKFTNDTVSEAGAQAGSSVAGRHVKLSVAVQRRVEKIMANNLSLESRNYGVVVDALMRKFLALYDAFYATALVSGLVLGEDDARLMVPLRNANSKSGNPEKVDWLESFLRGVPAQPGDDALGDEDCRRLSHKDFTLLNRQSTINLGLTTVSVLTKCLLVVVVFFEGLRSRS